MAIKLGKNPESFKKPIKLVTIDGVEDTLIITFKYRTRLEFATLMDTRDKQDKERAEATKVEPVESDSADIVVPPVAPTYEDQLLAALDISIDRVLEVATGWDLPEPFNKENLSILEGMYPTVLGHIQDLYQASVLEARKKN